MEDLFSNDFLPHGYCLVWQPRLLLLHVISDSLIALAYYSIPVGIAYFVGARRDLAYRWMFMLFSLFIFACGTTHLLAVVTMWEPIYWIDGWMKATTAGVSIATAILLWPVIPKALSLPSPSSLQRANEELQLEIAQRKQTEHALSEHARELAQSNNELEHFARVAAHDLQEPLRTITSYLQLLQRRYKGKLDADADDFIDTAVNGAKRMRALINDLLLYTRIGKSKEPFKAVDCETIVEQVIDNLQAIIEETQAQITFAKLPAVLGDRSQIAQLFQNLIGNAIKFRGEAPPKIHISAELAEPVEEGQQEMWCFRVTDNGIGIAPEYAEQIFHVFERLHSIREYPGTGIGLSICQKVVEHHGGHIGLESQLGQGSTFYFTIPSTINAS